MQFDVVFVGEQFDRFTEVDVLLLLHETEHVATQTAAEAVPDAQGRADVETRGLLVMKGA